MAQPTDADKCADPCANETEVRPIRKRSQWTRREPTTVVGEILISHNHMALLHGLYDRPGGTAASHTEWVRASMPHVARFRRYPSKACLSIATRTIHPCWVTRVRRGRRVEVGLSRRGPAIVERRLPTRIRGWGLYEGMRAITWMRQGAESLVTHAPQLPPESIREAVAYSNEHGMPRQHRRAEKVKKCLPHHKEMFFCLVV